MKYGKFDKYWKGFEKINNLLIVAHVLDPRCKMGFVELCFEKLYGQGNNKCVEVKGEIENLLRMLYDVYSASYKSSVESAESTKASGNKDDCIIVLDASVDGLDEGFDLSDVGIEEKEEEDPFGVWGQMAYDKGSVGKSSNELEIYLMEKIENPKSNKLGAPYDVLSWWKLNERKYPVLARLAKDVLAILVSTVSYESAFSIGGRILDEYRSCLTPYMVEALILTHNWLRSSPQYDAGVTIKQVMEENAFMDKVTKELHDQSFMKDEE